MTPVDLLADIGGTHARFALSRDGTPGEPLVLSTADFDDLAGALRAAVDRLGAPALRGIAACAAGPPRDATIRMTNCPWVVREADLAAWATGGPVVLVNDFTAQAAALGALAPADRRAIGGGRARPDAARAVIGPGTGLGLSACLPAPGGEVYVTGEGGHVSLAPANAEEDRILSRLRARFGHVSAERVLSGDGLANLYRAMHPDAGATATAPASGEAVAAQATAGDPRAVACVRQFSAWLGAVCGDVALVFGAEGGVFLTGGILPAWGDLFDTRAFRERFEAKGRYARYLGNIPTWLITARHPALLGLVRLLER